MNKILALVLFIINTTISGMFIPPIPKDIFTFGPTVKWNYYKDVGFKFVSIGIEASYWRLPFSPINIGVDYQKKPYNSLFFYYQMQLGIILGVSMGPYYEMKLDRSNNSFGLMSDIWLCSGLCGDFGGKWNFESKSSTYSGLLLKPPIYMTFYR